MGKRNDLLDYNQIKWAITPIVLFKLALADAATTMGIAHSGIRTASLFILNATIIIPSTNQTF